MILDGRPGHIGIGSRDEDGPNDDVQNEAASMRRRGKIKRLLFREETVGVGIYIMRAVLCASAATILDFLEREGLIGCYATNWTKEYRTGCRRFFL